MSMPVTNTAKPLPAVTPLVSGVATAEIALDADLATAVDQPIIGLRVIVDPGDDITAANALMSGAGCSVLLPDSSLSIETGAAIVAVYMVAIGSAAEPADYTGGVGVISIAENDVADVQASMVRLDFSDLDVVRKINLSLTTWGSGLVGRVFVEASSYA